jgi:hypothetical protein
MLLLVRGQHVCIWRQDRRASPDLGWRRAYSHHPQETLGLEKKQRMWFSVCLRNSLLKEVLEERNTELRI